MEKNEKLIFIRKDKMGIMPIGALSVAFASYIEGVDTFIESRKTHYNIGDKLKINLRNETKEIALTAENYTNDISFLYLERRMPEIILFSPPNHRLISAVDELVNIIDNILKFEPIGKDIDSYIPKFVMLSNGIYYDDIMNHISNSLRHIDNDIIEKIKGNFVRATTLQTGVREDNIEDNDKSIFKSIFKPGTKGGIVIAGGSKESRERIKYMFDKHQYPVTEMEGEEIRRIEFDKAIINLSTNAVQLSLLFDDNGNIQNLTMGDLVSNLKMQELCKKIIYTMASIGVKSGIYKNIPPGQTQQQYIESICEKEWKKLEEKSRIDNVHIVSTIAIVIERYRKGNKGEGKKLRIPPLEENIINYLLKLSNENNLEKEKGVIESLRDSILQSCERLWC